MAVTSPTSNAGQPSDLGAAPVEDGTYAYTQENFQFFDMGHIKAMNNEQYLTTIGVSAVFMVIVVAAFISYYRKLRRILDMPTSKIRSAAQGYVELEGKQTPFQKTPLIAPLTKKPCTWYRYLVEHYDGKNWNKIEEVISSDLIALNDGTGICVIDPDGAYVTPSIRTSKRAGTYFEKLVTSGSLLNGFGDGEYAYTEWRMEINSQLHVLGYFKTINPLAPRNTENTDGDKAALSHLLSKWKKDKKTLLSLFDKNKDNEIDIHEWEQVVQKAQEQLGINNKSAKDTDTSSCINMISKETLDSSQPYMLSNYSSNFMIFCFKWYAFGFSLLSIASISFIAWLACARYLL